LSPAERLFFNARCTSSLLNSIQFNHSTTGSRTMSETKSARFKLEQITKTMNELARELE